MFLGIFPSHESALQVCKDELNYISKATDYILSVSPLYNRSTKIPKLLFIFQLITGQASKLRLQSCAMISWKMSRISDQTINRTTAREQMDLAKVKIFSPMRSYDLLRIFQPIIAPLYSLRICRRSQFCLTVVRSKSSYCKVRKIYFYASENTMDVRFNLFLESCTVEIGAIESIQDLNFK